MVSRDRLGLSLAVVALVPAIFTASLPPLADVHRQADDTATQGAYKLAVGSTAAVVLGAAIITNDPAVAAAGLGALGLFGWLYYRARLA